MFSDYKCTKIYLYSIDLWIFLSFLYNNDRYSKSICNLAVTNCGKVCKSRICSIAVHPSVTKTIAAFGDKQGYVGIWDVVSF